jgi:uncharacterized damage-inducible protein DinB
MVRVESVINSWKSIREDTAQAVEDFSAHELDYKPSPDLMTFGAIARHVLEAGYGVTGLLLDGVVDMTTPQFRETIGKYAAELPKTEGTGALARELRSAMAKRIEQLAAQPPDFFAGEVTRFDKQRVTRLEMLQGLKEHELTHRSQLFLYLRLRGIVPPTTRRRLAQASA